MDQCRRRLVGTGVQCGTVTAADVSRVLDAAIHGQACCDTSERITIRCSKSHRWTANRWILEIDEIKTVPHAPL